MSRTSDRKDQTVEVRVTWAEQDLDIQERELGALEARLGRMLWTLVGILVSTTTASILLALNLAVATR